jgi:hypothetical protein
VGGGADESVTLSVPLVFGMRIPGWRKTLPALVLMLVLAPAVWNLAATRWVHWKNPVPGAFFSVGGYQMHIHCTGSGLPTVVMEAAATASWLAWRRVQPQLSQRTRVCSYDRAGHGWSNLRPGSRDADHVVGELHDLLNQAGVERPLLLVGHSARRQLAATARCASGLAHRVRAEPARPSRATALGDAPGMVRMGASDGPLQR